MNIDTKFRGADPRMGSSVMHPWRLVILAMVLVVTVPAAAAELEQTIVLQPGWNAVFLEVAPSPNDPESVFQGLPVSSVWRWNPEGIQADYLRNPADGLEAQPGWLGYFPPHLPESILTNLYAIEPNTAYLVKVGGASPIMWTVRGVPVLRDREWIADSFNLRGFHVNPGAEPSVADYFGPAKAHAGQPVYRLTSAGIWELVTAPYSTPVESGVAYWVFSDGPSSYKGPIEVRNEFGNGIEFGGALTESTLVFSNSSSVPAIVSLRGIGAGPSLPLLYKNIDEVSSEESWPDLPNTLSIEIESRDEDVDGQSFVDLGVRRNDLDGRVETILEVVDSLGGRRRMLVSASSPFTPAEAKTASNAKRVAAGPAARKAAGAVPLAGLWVGTVTVNAVSESQVGGVEPLPTGGGMDFRVLIHVNTGGEAKLLKEVIQMYEVGTMVPDSEDPSFLTLENAGRYVLLTDDSLIPQYTGADLRDGTPVGMRVSTAAYDFPGQHVVLSGSFGPGDILTGTLTLDAEAPTNPFRAKYHPDHDNLDAQFLAFREEAYTVVRAMTFEFTLGDPEGKNLKPGWGDTDVGGFFRETITGLHKNDISVEGIFRLRRMSYTPVLNE